MFHSQSGGQYRYETFQKTLQAAFVKAELPVPERFRPCHDLRVTAITADALAGADPIAVMAKAGHASFDTTKRYLKLAGVDFRAQADAQAARLLGELSTEVSTDLRAPERSEHHPISLDQAGDA